MRFPRLLTGLCLALMLSFWVDTPTLFGRDPMEALTDFDTGAEGRSVTTNAPAGQQSAGAQQQTGTVHVNTYLNVRSSPWGSIIGQLVNGQQVSIVGRSGEWLKIMFHGRLAYIHSDYVTVSGGGNDGSTSGGARPGGTAPSTPGNTGSSAALERWRGGRLPPAEFIRMLGPVARESFRRTGVPASVTLAQAALETGWGRATIGDAKNLFGIKGRGPAGSITVRTREVVNGRSVYINAAFRKYNTWLESVEDHANLLKNGSRYRRAFQYSNNPDQFAREIHRAGYATDPNYSRTLISLMKSYNLYQWDR